VLLSRNNFFRSGSDFQKVSAPAPAPEPAPATALELPAITDFMLKRTFFMFLIKENRPHMLDPIQYEFIFFQNSLADPEPEPKLQYSGSSQKFRLLAAPAPQHCCTHSTADDSGNGPDLANLD
jgi:hypothetical protein